MSGDRKKVADIKHDDHCERRNYPGRVECSCAERAWRRDPLPPDEMATTKERP